MDKSPCFSKEKWKNLEEKLTSSAETMEVFGPAGDGHTYATLLHENGNSLHTIQNLMIHLRLQPSRLKRLLSKVKVLFG